MEQQAGTRDDPPGSLCCTLLDRRSSIPLSGARITCIGPDQRVTRFDADGNGRFGTTMPQGVYDLVISARGYLSLLVRGVGVLAGHQHTVTRALVPGEGQDPDSGPASALGGYITDRLGRGVRNVTVTLSAEAGNAHTTCTERDGAYLLHGIAPQRYTLTVFTMKRRLAREIVPIAGARDFVRLDLRLAHV